MVESAEDFFAGLANECRQILQDFPADYFNTIYDGVADADNAAYSDND